MTVPSDPPFNVSYLPAVRERLQEWSERAVRAGLRLEFLAAVRDLDQQLHAHPREWGDPQYGYHKLELTLYRRYGPVLWSTTSSTTRGT